MSNHVSWTDIIVFLNINQPAFAAKRELKDIPVFGLLCQALGCIFIAREGSLDARNQVIDQIRERQESIETEGLYPPIVVYPEGGTSNGTSVLSFKKGAFAGLKPVRPVFLRYDYDMLNNSYDVMPFFALFVLQCCCFNYRVTFNELPPFIPNDYLFNQYAKKLGGEPKEKWDIYAESVRDILVKVGGSKRDNIHYREKIAYEIELGYVKKRETPNKTD